MLHSREVFKTEVKLMESISIDFFQRDIASGMDAEIYEAYVAIQRLRRALEKHEILAEEKQREGRAKE